MVRLLYLVLILVSGCVSTADRASSTWYEAAEVVCFDARCARCVGRSHYGCPPCRATGQLPCNRCSDGTETCGTCKGDGQKKGKKCDSCGGDGKRACSTCGGDRLMACGTCSALGQLTCLRPMRVSEPMPGPEDQWPPAPVQK